MNDRIKTLSWLLQGLDIHKPLPDDMISRVTCDSREAGPGSLFVAIQGTAADGHRFVADAVSKGAAAVLTEHSVESESVPCFRVHDTRYALAHIARRFYDFPDESLIMIGVTGTNGKTTVATMIAEILNHCGLQCGLLGTVTYRWPGHEEAASHTTPDAVRLFSILRRMADEGVMAVSMEVSSHALVMERVAGIQFKAAVFTNLTRDHLDFHKDFEAYGLAKSHLFRQLAAKGAGIINMDDPAASVMSGACHQKCVGFSRLSDSADYRIETIETTIKGTRFRLHHQNRIMEFFTPLLGGFNIYNASAAAVTALELGLHSDEIQTGLAGIDRIPGRMDGIRSKRGFRVVVDYAHTPDALQNALKTAREFTPHELITVFGCGGDRDRGKRPEMGRIAVELSHHTVITSDNPRTEDPQMIIQDILQGLPAYASYRVIEDRESAIRYAIMRAGEGDTVMIAGKGHEDYQISGTQKIHFDDRETAIKYLNE